ncbi:hypothetical protein F4859DRAFT_178129 [Xylaria cf. heliscus]|nr:hypothetical protein F4859DRAFT_178129 [Xylaria cf. heliscus]
MTSRRRRRRGRLRDHCTSHLISSHLLSGGVTRICVNIWNGMHLHPRVHCCASRSRALHNCTPPWKKAGSSSILTVHTCVDPQSRDLDLASIARSVLSLRSATPATGPMLWARYRNVGSITNRYSSIRWISLSLSYVSPGQRKKTKLPSDLAIVQQLMQF